MNSFYITQLIKQYNFILRSLSFEQQMQIKDYELLVVRIKKNNATTMKLMLKPVERIAGDSWAVIDSDSAKEDLQEKLEKEIAEYAERGVSIKIYEYNVFCCSS